MKKNSKSIAFLCAFLAFFLLLDGVICYLGEHHSPIQVNDYEIARAAHPEKVWDKVFFGSSAVTSAYREDVSESGYIGLGLDYGTVGDLWEMIRQGHITLGSDLVVGLNLFSLYDGLKTDPSYLWHRGPLEPYTYFHREKLKQIGTILLNDLQNKDVWYDKGSKELYYGSKSQGEMEWRMKTYWEEYFNEPMEDFQKNLKALEKTADWCQKHGVRMRVVWMQYNPTVERPQRLDDLMEAVAAICEPRGIEILDLSTAFPKECFHDVNHLNYEYGAYVFTRTIDSWLMEES